MEEWRQCVQWLIECGVLAPTHRATWPEAQVFDLAQTLRDGVLLCQLLNNLKPGSVDLRQINLRPQMSQFLCQKKHHTFLGACRTKFGMGPDDLFDARVLFEVTDFLKVIKTLSKLSNTHLAIQAGKRPFPNANARYEEEDDDDDIYRNLEDLANECDLADEDDLYDTVPVEDEDIYGDIVGVQQPIQKSLSVHEKKNYVVKELLDTEKNYVEALNMIVQYFILPLRNIISTDDEQIIFINIQDLFNVHKGFLQDLEKASRHQHTNNISKCFLDWKDRMLIYGQYCSDMQYGQDHVDSLCQRKPEVRTKIESQLRGLGQVQLEVCTGQVNTCQMACNQGKFRLRDLLSVPMQRVLKYHLLLRELIKHIQKTPMAPKEEKEGLEQALAAMQDLAQYVNEVKRDNETVETIRKVQESITDYPEGKDLSDYGRLLRDGELRFKNQRDNNVQNRYCFLFDKAMVLCKPLRRSSRMSEYIIPNCQGDTYSLKDVLELSDQTIDECRNAVPEKGFFARDRWNHYWEMSDKRGACGWTVYVKTSELKRKWLEAVSMALDNLCPRQLTQGKGATHQLEMYTFKEPTRCSVCSKLLRGIFYQGYFCSVCGKMCHKECIGYLEACKTDAPPPPPRDFDAQSPAKVRMTLTPAPVLPPRNPVSPRIPTAPSPLENRHMIVQADRAYHGIPPPPIGDRKPLTFNDGERIETTNTTDREWWEGRRLRDLERGWFPKDCVSEHRISRSHKPSYEEPESRNTNWRPRSLATNGSPAAPNRSLQSFSWYTGQMERAEAEKMLDSLSMGVYLVRESARKPGQWAISLKHKMVKHIKVNEHNGCVFIAEAKMFPNIVELVEYYQKNSLGSSFPGLDITLATPYKEYKNPQNRNSMPPANPVPTLSRSNRRSRQYHPIGTAMAKYQFAARDMRELSLQEGEKVTILSKAGGDQGWWKGQRADGKMGYFPSTYVEEVDE
ncbi:guanine nucleotide exchange factor VAV2-like isoform X4 [Branchiostoma floridae]|uniref:Guanine nucleotide exchange factor VAV2-like isoform X4 n=1 Tax=Branchiostoma floridae TaxID=7739 RepID=A0A9J7LMU5_BRAFL|nr:guanine nucleotide exchange factor VAV2-like isoform X4 [Branchiostoma floridae]